MDPGNQTLIRLALIFQCVYGAIAFVALLSAATVTNNLWAMGAALSGVFAIVLSQSYAMKAAWTQLPYQPATSDTRAAMRLWWLGIMLAALSFVSLVGA